MPQMAMHVGDGHSMMHDPISRHCLAECKLFVRGSAANSSPVISSGPSTLESMDVVRVCTFFASFQFGGSPCGVTWSAPRVGNNLASPEILNKVHCSKTHPAFWHGGHADWKGGGVNPSTNSFALQFSLQQHRASLDWILYQTMRVNPSASHMFLGYLLQRRQSSDLCPRQVHSECLASRLQAIQPCRLNLARACQGQGSPSLRVDVQSPIGSS